MSWTLIPNRAIPPACGEILRHQRWFYLPAGKAPRFSAIICYSYTVDGIPRASTRIDFGDPLRLTKDEALASVYRNYPLGKKVTVYYDSKNPDLAVLVPGAGEMVLNVWCFAGTAAFCCAASLLLLIRQKKRACLT